MIPPMRQNVMVICYMYIFLPKDEHKPTVLILENGNRCRMSLSHLVFLLIYMTIELYKGWGRGEGREGGFSQQHTKLYGTYFTNGLIHLSPYWIYFGKKHSSYQIGLSRPWLALCITKGNSISQARGGFRPLSLCVLIVTWKYLIKLYTPAA